MAIKQCVVCNRVFETGRQKRNGLRGNRATTCSDKCEKAKKRKNAAAYRKQFPEKHREYARKHRERNPDAVRRYARNYYSRYGKDMRCDMNARARASRKQNPDKVRGKQREQYQRNREKINIRRKNLRKRNRTKYVKQYKANYQRNREKILARYRADRARHPEKYREQQRKRYRRDFEKYRKQKKILSALRSAAVNIIKGFQLRCDSYHQQYYQRNREKILAEGRDNLNREKDRERKRSLRANNPEKYRESARKTAAKRTAALRIVKLLQKGIMP